MDQEESLEARVDVKIKDSGLVEEKTEESFHLFIRVTTIVNVGTSQCKD